MVRLASTNKLTTYVATVFIPGIIEDVLLLYWEMGRCELLHTPSNYLGAVVCKHVRLSSHMGVRTRQAAEVAQR